MSHDAISRFWENFVEKTKAYNLKPTAVRWHVTHAKEYIRAHSGRRLAGHKAEDIAAYLREKGRNGRLADWQFAQVVRALQILFVEMAKAPWAVAFPWQDWIQRPGTGADACDRGPGLRPRSQCLRAGGHRGQLPAGG